MNKNNILLSKFANFNVKGLKRANNVFIIGSKGIPSTYGGYETFVDKLTEYNRHKKDIQYFVACKANGKGVTETTKNREPIFEYNGAICFKVSVPHVGSAEAIFYDCNSIECVLQFIKENNISSPIIYVLACRIGPWTKKYVKQIHTLGGKFYVNPDGHEWMRSKWSKPVRNYWKFSERLMVKYADLLICDSKNIETYICDTYKKYNPKTKYIAYGAETTKSILEDDDISLKAWFEKFAIKPNLYYLIVGRFVPENNYETMIREFMCSNTNKDLVIITTKNDSLYNELETKLSFSKDKRIKFVGTVYDKELLKKIREKAFAYLHGHEVGGTNPSLLEALGSTELNLLLDVGFNKECAEDGALYWNKDMGNLASLIDQSERMNKELRNHFGNIAKKRIENFYSWDYISKEYENTFLNKE
jgi:Glycosyltransferase